MDEPAPVIYSTPKSEEIILKREHILTKKKKSYKLQIYMDKSFIYFKITENNNISLFYYQNKYNYEQIIELLKLDNKIFINLEIVFDIIENAILDGKIKISFDNYNNIMFKIYLQNEKKNKNVLILNKQKLGINEKFSIIINEINNLKNENKNKLKKDKFSNLQLLLDYLNESTNKKIEKNEKQLNLLKSNENDNEKILNENKAKIISLKNQIKIIEDKIFNLKKENIDNKGNNNNINIDNNIKNNIEKESKKYKIKEEDLKIEKLYEFNQTFSLLYKIILIGETCSGKTWIIDSYISYPSENFGTIGFDIKNCLLKINETVVKLMITDCPGMEKYFDLAKTYCKNKDLIMFVYAIDDINSFDAIQQRIKDIKPLCKNNTSYILIGNKADLNENRVISYEKGLELATNENMDLFIEVSAKMSFNIDELFFEAVKIIYKKNK